MPLRVGGLRSGDLALRLVGSPCVELGGAGRTPEKDQPLLLLWHLSLRKPATATVKRGTTPLWSGTADHNKASVSDQAVDVVLDDQLGLACGALAAREGIDDQLRRPVEQQRDGRSCRPAAPCPLLLPWWRTPGLRRSGSRCRRSSTWCLHRLR